MAETAVKPIRINLVEHELWDQWESSGDIMSYSYDSAFQMFQAYRKTEASKWIHDIMGSSAGKTIHDWSPTSKKLDSEELEALEEALKKRDLEQTSQMVLDAMAWAWQEAYTPTDRNIRDALDEAIDTTVENNVFHEGDEELWAPLLAAGWTPEKIVSGLLANTVTYSHEPNHYDRYLNFPFQDSDAIKTLLEHDPDIARLNAYLKDLADELVSALGKRLSKDMERVDVSNRVDFDDQWKAMLKDKSVVKSARKEMLEYLEEKGDLDERQAKLIARSILALAVDGRLGVEAAAELHGPEHPELHREQTAKEAAELLGFSKGQISRYIEEKRGR